MDTTTGAVRRLAGRRVEVDDTPDVVQIGDRIHAVDARRGLIHALPDTPVVVAENGCALLRASETSTLDVGPWTLQCPGPKGAR